MKDVVRIALLNTLAAVAVCGCSLPKIEKVAVPTAQVASVRAVESGPQGTRLEIVVELKNTNPKTALPLVQADYTVGAGSTSHTFRDVPNRTLPGGGKQTVTLPATFADANGLTGTAYRVSGTITYKPPGEIRDLMTESKIPLPTVAFTGEGTIE